MLLLTLVQCFPYNCARTAPAANCWGAFMLYKQGSIIEPNGGRAYALRHHTIWRETI